MTGLPPVDLRIAIVAESSLLAPGLVAALTSIPGWRVVGPDEAADLTVNAGHEITIHAHGAGGAAAWLSASADGVRLRAAVAAVAAGLSVREGAWPGPAARSEASPDHEPLTPRELEVYELLGKGLSNRDIGGVLGISAHTAKYHVGQILAKVGAATRAEAVREGLRLGLIGL